MAPYAPSSFDGGYAASAPPKPNRSDREEDVIFTLTERLRAREDEIRHLRQQKSELENQLVLRGNPIKLDKAYEELLTHLKRREEDFRKENAKQDDRLRDVERENRKLREQLHDSQKMLEEQKEGQEKKLKVTEKVMADELDAMQRRLRGVMAESDEKDRRMDALEEIIDRLNIEADCKQEKDERDKELLARLGDRVENYKLETADLDEVNEELVRANDELARQNDDLQRRVDTQRHLLKEKEDEIVELERFRDQREDDLTADMDQMRRRYADIIAAHRDALEDREEELHLLHVQCERYEDIIDEAEYITHEQRATLKARKREIEKLSEAIERSQNAGLLGQLDRMCNASNAPATSSLVR